MSNQTQEYKNDQVTVLVTRKPGCHIKFEIAVSPQGAEAAYSKATKTIKKEVSIPGFRKGKVPDNMIAQKYASYIEQEFRDTILQTGFQEALNLTQIYPLNDKSLKKPHVKNCSKTEGTNITIEFEASPEVPKIDVTNLKLKKSKKHKAITENDIDDAVEEARFHFAQWEDVTGRKVEEGDYIDLDIDAISDPAHNICVNQRFHVKPGEMGAWMRKLVIGLEPDQTAEGLSEKDEHVHTAECDHSHDEPEAEFKPTQVRVTLKGIKKVNLPELNDEFAKKVGANSVPQLRERVKESLEKRAKDQDRQGLREQMEKLLLETYDFDVPESFLNAEIQPRLNKKLNILKKQNVSEEEIEKQKATLESEATAEAKDDLKLFFLAKQIADQEKFTVTKEEIYKELSRQMWGMPAEQSVIDSSMKPEEIETRLYLMLISNKATDFLIDRAKIS